MKESNFANEIKKSCQQFKCFYYKIPDAYGMARFSPPKPFDAFVVYDGKYFAFEYKMMKSQTAFPFNKVRPHQISNLLEVKKAGGYSFIIINYRMKHYNKAFYISIKDFVKFQKTIGKQRKSIPFDIIKECSEIYKYKLWRVQEFLDFYLLYEIKNFI